MSKFWKIGLPVIVVVIIIIAGVWYSSNQATTDPVRSSHRAAISTASTTTISKSDGSDSALNSDLNQIDAEMNASAQDSSAINVNQ